MKRLRSFDIDGVIRLDDNFIGLYPNPGDIIITGRSIDEAAETLAWLADVGIHNQVFFNNVPYEHKSRKLSGEHKANILRRFLGHGYDRVYHYEDDEVQYLTIIECLSEHFSDDRFKIIRVDHGGLLGYENARPQKGYV